MHPVRNARRVRFTGEIAGIGTTSGHRIVVGSWPMSPFGPVADVMVESPAGLRTLLAPTEQLAAFVADTYTFDAVRVVEVRVSGTGSRRTVDAGPLQVTMHVGGRDVVGRALAALPERLSASPAWTWVTDPVARLFLRGVRTRGSAGNGRREWYGASDRHRIVAATAAWDGVDLGTLAPVRPAVRFGFGSVPARPSLVAVTTTVELPAAEVTALVGPGEVPGPSGPPTRPGPGLPR
jgi:hypothetical protein